MQSRLMAFLLLCAKQQKLVTYGDIEAHLGVPAHSMEMNRLLAETSAHTYNTNRVMLSALVVTQRKGSPGKGFFDLASELGKSFDDELEFWCREVRRVFEWAKVAT
jgi:hypothetical protein